MSKKTLKPSVEAGSRADAQQSKHLICVLCRIAGVSRAGYDAWLKATPLRQQHEEPDRVVF